MRTGWRHVAGGIVAILGMVGLLLSAAAPAFARPAPAGGFPAQQAQHHQQHRLPAMPAAAAVAPDGAGPEAPPPDCPEPQTRACCPVAGCGAGPLLAADLPRAATAPPAPDGFARRAARVPAGVDAAPLTPPPRRGR